MRQQRLSNIETLLRRKRQAYGAIQVRPLSPVIGAEVEGVDLQGDLSEVQVAELRRALLEHHVLVFRNHAPVEDLPRGTARLFGLPVEPCLRGPAIPPEAYTSREARRLAETWRADETFRSAPPAGGVAQVRLPPVGARGDALFANMQLAYALLSDPLKALLADLTAVHARDPQAGDTADVDGSAEHPMVVRHPVTGVPTLFVNRTHTSHIVELEPSHSKATLEMLCRHLETQPVITCRVRLTPDMVVVWDNLAVQHLTILDVGAPCPSESVVWLAGDRPERWDGRASDEAV